MAPELQLIFRIPSLAYALPNKFVIAFTFCVVDESACNLIHEYFAVNKATLFHRPMFDRCINFDCLTKYRSRIETLEQ